MSHDHVYNPVIWLLYFRWVLVQTLSLKSNLLKGKIVTLYLENITQFFHMNMKGLCLLHDYNSFCLFDWSLETSCWPCGYIVIHGH